MALGSLCREARQVVLPLCSNVFTPSRAPDPHLGVNFLFKAILAVTCLTLDFFRHSLAKSPTDQKITAEK